MDLYRAKRDATNLAKFSVPSVVEDNTASVASSLMPAAPEIINDDAATKVSESATEEAVMVASNGLPKWCNADKITGVMEKRKKRTQAQYCRDQFVKNAESALINRRYADAFKKATEEFKQRKMKCKSNHGGGVWAICKRLNETELNQPFDKKLKPSVVSKAVDDGRAGMSPPKKGRPRIVPKELTHALAVHSTMMQVSALEGEASAPKMKTVVRALTQHTNWDGKIKDYYAWRRKRMDFPELTVLNKAMNHEDRRAEWLTVKNINDWTDNGKAFLVSIGLVKDEPGFICE